MCRSEALHLTCNVFKRLRPDGPKILNFTLDVWRVHTPQYQIKAIISQWILQLGFESFKLRVAKSINFKFAQDCLSCEEHHCSKPLAPIWCWRFSGLSWSIVASTTQGWSSGMRLTSIPKDIPLTMLGPFQSKMCRDFNFSITLCCNIFEWTK